MLPSFASRSTTSYRPGGCDKSRRNSKPKEETSTLLILRRGPTMGMQLKRFQLFRDDVRDLVNLTVDRSSYALKFLSI